MRRLARSALAHGLARTGLDRSLGRLRGVGKAPLILGYHRVIHDSVTVPSRGVPSMGIKVSTLAKHLDFVGHRFRFVSLDEMGARLESGTAEGLAAVTFDDGYADFFENAFPLLQRKGVPAAVFVVTGLLEKGEGFLHDRVYLALDRALRQSGAPRVLALLGGEGLQIGHLPDSAFAATRTLLRILDQESLSRLCAALEVEFGIATDAPRSLSWDQVVSMSRAGLTVGSHTRTHALLTRESVARVIGETVGSRMDIEARLGVPVSHFVYPDGCFDEAAVSAVAAAGYRYAYTGCHHRDARHPLLTLSRRVLWEGSTLGALGGFSADVLSSHINGIFDRAGRCTQNHGVAAKAGANGASIAIVAPSLDVLGGQSIQAAAVLAGLREEGFKVTFLATDPRFPWGLRFLRRVPLIRTLLNQGLYVVSLRHLREADVVHAFSASFWSFLLAPVPAMLVARALGKRVVLNYHSGEAQDHLLKWGVLVHPWLRLAHQIVVPSDYLRQIFLEHGYRARVVRNVVDTSRFGYKDRASLRPRFLSTRSLEPNYRVDDVIRAFALVKAERPDATLVIAGSGSEEGRLRRMAEPISGITFVGALPPAHVPELLASADLFLNASVVDNQPLSLLEAFAAGLPVITTATGGIAAMVGHSESGLIVPPSDPSAMALAALGLLRDEGLATRLAKGARAVAETHSWPRVRDHWTEVYSGSGFDGAPFLEEDPRGRNSVPSIERAGPEPRSIGKERQC